MSAMRFGLIGYGAWGRFHARALAKTAGAELCAICCKTEASAAAARQDYPGLPVFRDYRELLANVPLDAVNIVVPTHLHAEIGVAALERGLDVLLEKPMALNAAECDRLIAAAERGGRVLSIGHELRLSSQWGAIKRFIDAGDIGDPLYAHVSLFRNPYRKGQEHWRWRLETVGSWILEEPVHFYDLVMWYFEKEGAPVSVWAAGNNRDREEGLYDNFTSIVRFPRGIYAVITQSIAGFEHHQIVEVVGKAGSIRATWSGIMDRTLEPSHSLKVQRRGRDSCEEIALAPSGEVFELEEELRCTVAAFRERKPLLGGAEAKRRIVICLEAERALREGKELRLEW
jgi:myo-inositol 2-dehydrogenase/D-chiro-inositol 1-dehydrogenase